MDRRKFIKIGALGTLFSGTGIAAVCVNKKKELGG
jgi:predicted flavoprotein YhiN